MKKAVKTILIAAALLLAPVAAGSLLPEKAYAVDPKDEVCSGLSGKSEDGECTVEGQTSIQHTINTVINILTLIAGIAAVIMIIIGGFRYVVSAGDSSGISAAKNTIIYALVGLVVIALAHAIVKFVINRIL